MYIAVVLNHLIVPAISSNYTISPMHPRVSQLALLYLADVLKFVLSSCHIFQWHFRLHVSQGYFSILHLPLELKSPYLPFIGGIENSISRSTVWHHASLVMPIGDPRDVFSIIDIYHRACMKIIVPLVDMIVPIGRL